MRYADGGGLTQAGRRRREQVRQQAADLFTAGVSAVEVAAQLEVSTKSAYAWRRAWKPAVEKVWSHLKRSLANL